MRWDLSGEETLQELSGRWLEEIAGTIDPGTKGLYAMHFSAHLTPHFGTPQGISAATIVAYCRKRLKLVKRSTLKKERSSLRSFLSWCHENGLLLEPVELPPLPKRAQGTAFAVRRRGKATELTPEECRSIIALLPNWSAGRLGVKPFPIRARFTVMYETALRPATLSKLIVGEHYSRGMAYIRITDAIDKARFGRDLPLSLRAREALDFVLPKSGLIFGDHEYRRYLERAAKLVIGERAATFCPYDFRHARITELAQKGGLSAVQFIAGHKRAETTSIYIHADRVAAAKLLDEVGVVSAIRRPWIVDTTNLLDNGTVGAKRGTRTPTPVKGLEPESCSHIPTEALKQLAERADAIVRAASEGGEAPSEEQAKDFARSVIAPMCMGPAVLGVLEGGPHQLSHALHLAGFVIAEHAVRLAEGELSLLEAARAKRGGGQ